MPYGSGAYGQFAYGQFPQTKQTVNVAVGFSLALAHALAPFAAAPRVSALAVKQSASAAPSAIARPIPTMFGVAAGAVPALRGKAPCSAAIAAAPGIAPGAQQIEYVTRRLRTVRQAGAYGLFAYGQFGRVLAEYTPIVFGSSAGQGAEANAIETISAALAEIVAATPAPAGRIGVAETLTAVATLAPAESIAGLRAVIIAAAADLASAQIGGGTAADSVGATVGLPAELAGTNPAVASAALAAPVSAAAAALAPASASVGLSAGAIEGGDEKPENAVVALPASFGIAARIGVRARRSFTLAASPGADAARSFVAGIAALLAGRVTGAGAPRQQENAAAPFAATGAIVPALSVAALRERTVSIAPGASSAEQAREDRTVTVTAQAGLSEAAAGIALRKAALGIAETMRPIPGGQEIARPFLAARLAAAGRFSISIVARGLGITVRPSTEPAGEQTARAGFAVEAVQSATTPAPAAVRQFSIGPQFGVRGAEQGGASVSGIVGAVASFIGRRFYDVRGARLLRGRGGVGTMTGAADGGRIDGLGDGGDVGGSEI